MTEWVKVTKDKNTLPEELQTVWIYGNYTRSIGCWYGYDKKGDPIWWTKVLGDLDFGFTGYNILYWMPLPEDPKDA